nr:uncharacterized protein LOC129282087 [Lytechinus pictus]
MKPLKFLCRIIIGYTIGVTSVYACEGIPFSNCRRVLPYNATTYPNYLDHLSATQSVAIYSSNLEIYQVLGCHKLLFFFVCSLVAPKCDATGLKIPPCQELCYMVRGGCMGHPEVRCSEFPLMSENPNCISDIMAELVTSPPPPIITTTVTEPRTSRTTTGPHQGPTSSGPTEASGSPPTTVTMTSNPKMISPSSETSENTVTYRTQGVDIEVNDETLDEGKSYEVPAGVILGVSIGTLVTMVYFIFLSNFSLFSRFYTQCKSPNARARPAPETYGGFYANPAFENTNSADFCTQPSTNGPNQGGPIVNSSQTNTRIAAELAITQLPPHPASRPLHTLPVCQPGPHTNGTLRQDQTPDSNKTSTLPQGSHLNPYQHSQRRNTLPANSSPASACSSDQTKLPDTALDVPLSLKAGTLPPEKVIKNTGSTPYQEGSVPHYCTLNRRFANSKKSPKRFSRTSFLWRHNSSRDGKDVAPDQSSAEGTPTRFQCPAQDLVFANPAAKDEDCNKNGVLTEIDLTDDTRSMICQTKPKIDKRDDGNRFDLNKKTIENCSPVIANMSDKN